MSNTVENPTNNPTVENTNPVTPEGANDNSELLEKLDGILAKRFDGLAKSILKDNGVEDDDIKGLLAQYKANKEAQSKRVQDEYVALKSENDRLKKTILDGKLSSSAIKIAEQLGIDSKYIPQVMKLADLSAITNNGEVDEERLNEAMAKVIEECDVFKKSTKTHEEKGFKNIGGQNAGDEPEDKLAKIRKAMGLK